MFYKFIILFIAFVFPVYISASSVYFESFKDGDNYIVNVYLQSEKEINGLSGVLSFDNNLSLKRIDEGKSVVNFWLDKPHRDSDNKIVFSGFTPNGFKGKNLIFSAIFSLNKDFGVISPSDFNVFLNDGNGSVESVNYEDFILKKDLSLDIKTEKDNIKPELFFPEIQKDEALFDGKYFVVFSTIDKQSGIDKYQIKESEHRFINFSSRFVNAENPYILKDQDQRSFVFIRAFDYNGNFREVIIDPIYPLNWYENVYYWITIILLLTLIFFIRKICILLKKYF